MFDPPAGAVPAPLATGPAAAGVAPTDAGTQGCVVTSYTWGELSQVRCHPAMLCCYPAPAILPRCAVILLRGAVVLSGYPASVCCCPAPGCCHPCVAPARRLAAAHASAYRRFVRPFKALLCLAHTCLSAASAPANERPQPLHPCHLYGAFRRRWTSLRCCASAA